MKKIKMYNFYNTSLFARFTFIVVVDQFISESLYSLNIAIQFLSRRFLYFFYHQTNVIGVHSIKFK